jgi:ABC-type hemin transport system ATPase subunit
MIAAVMAISYLPVAAAAVAAERRQRRVRRGRSRPLAGPSAEPVPQTGADRFDEPTSALDPELVGEVILVMRQLARDGMTMVIVTYEMGFARDAATRMVFIDRGQVVETGTPAQFFSAPSTDRRRQFLQRYTAAGAAAIAVS